MSDALQQLIRQAEVQKLQMQMQVLFNKNLALFEDRMPKLHLLVSQHTAEEVVLRLDGNDQVNLMDLNTQQFMYSENPDVVCRNQVEQFHQSGNLRRLRITRNKEYNAEHIHIPCLNGLLDEYEDNQAKRLTKTPKFMPTLIVSGVGLGHHLNDLVDRYDIQNIIIYENCLDTFYGSMHVIDWAKILDYFRQKDRSISLCVGVEPRIALSQIESTIQRNGLYSQIFTFVYQHSRRPAELNFLDTYQKELRTFVGGLGYFDDEQIGLAHAYHNLKSTSAVFVSNDSHQRKPRLLLIGNGPSLDEHQEYIQRHRKNVVVMSCGTALSSLLRMGIKPDFHVEMERCIMVNDVIRHFSGSEDRNDITLLCLHTVAPETIEAFPESCYAIKANDAGGSLIRDYYQPQRVDELVFCNPTVANCGLSFAVSMGFEDIHLIGVDFGVLEAEKHHSKHSVYNEMEAFAKKEKIDYTIYDENRATPCKGNLGGTVMAMPTLNMARVSMERFLNFLKPMFPNLRCYNTNHGALIQHTHSVALKDIPPCAQIDAAQEVRNIKSDHFHVRRNKSFEKKSKNEILKYFYNVQKKLYISDKIEDEKSLYNELHRIYKLIRKDKDPCTHFLLRGSFNTFFGAITENALYCSDNEEFLRQVHIGIKHFNAFVDKIYAIMKDDPFKLDKTHSGYVQAMKVKETEEKQQVNA